MGIRKNCVAVNKRSPSVMACGPLCAASSASSRKCTHRPRCTDLWAVSEGPRGPRRNPAERLRWGE